MYSFGPPCFRYKLVLATKNQNGWPGFQSPYTTRYLSKLVTITSQPAAGGNSNTTSQGWITDRLTGLITSVDGNNNANADFPYGAILANNDNESWQVTDTQFVHTINNGYFIYTTTVALSDPYTFAMVQADTDALLASVSIASMPWNTLMLAQGSDQTVPLGQYFDGFGLQDALLPSQVIYSGLSNPGPTEIDPPMKAAAWAIYAPGAVSDQNYFPNGYSKLISYVMMAGNYCQKNYWLDFNLNVVNQQCISGNGACGQPFKVVPPAIPDGFTQNAYTLIIPNCQCGG